MPQSTFDVSEVKIRFANARGGGLVGWASCVLNGGLFLNNIAIFENEDGTFSTQFPARRGTNDQRYFYFCPINRETRALIDDAVLAYLNK